MNRKLLLALALLVAPGLAAASASGGGPRGYQWQHAQNDLTNLKSLQRGAKYYVNYCLGCHSLNHVRYQRLAEDLGMTEEQVEQNLLFAGDKVTEMMTIAMPAGDSERWFGRTPPDLSLIGRSRGPDWLFNYLTTFYVDAKRPFGVNNLILPNASMPHVLIELQGKQQARVRTEVDALGNRTEVFEGMELIEPGALSAEEYAAVARDLANFLDYVGEPVQLKRHNVGIGVLGFLLVFFLFAFLMNREYWKDVK
jgi:ubiquinol-cytochrome c reductase cytochrome c1 subunit